MQEQPVTPSSGVFPARALLVRAARTASGVAFAASVAAVMTGCEVDSFMDPSVSGRWEHTPTVMPILERLASIEEEPGEIVATSQIRSADLIPEVEEYRLASGDTIEVQILDFDQAGVPSGFEAILDERGFIDIPGLRGVYAEGKTKHEVAEAVKVAVREAGRLDNAQVSVFIRSQRKQTYSVIGAIAAPGAYFIPAADFRMLDALARSGQFDQNTKSLYVIRQVPLSDEAAGRLRSPQAPSPEPARPWGSGRGERPARPADAEDLLDLIDDLAGEKEAPKPSPGVLASGAARRGQPERSAPPIDLPGAPGSTPTPLTPGQPPIDLPQGGGDFVFRDGRWVRSTSVDLPTGQGLLTQRVIEVPVEQLLAGRADVNIVVRPGDVIRVPSAQTGLVYLAGQVNRPGPYGLPLDGGRLTLLRAIDSAGGLSSIAIPERVDLTRVVGPGRQATIRLNLRAIAEQTQPDIYLKPDDRINVGTNFWALPLAVIRNGFRMSYGFGFLLDRNFGNDVFGAPPDSSR